MASHTPLQAHLNPPGGTTNPPPTDKSQGSLDDSSPTLLTPPLLEDNTGFTLTTVARGLHTTPLHVAVLCPLVPLPMVTRNSYAMLLPPDSPSTPTTTVDHSPLGFADNASSQGTMDNPPPAGDDAPQGTVNDPPPLTGPTMTDNAPQRTVDDPPPLTGPTTTYALICPDGFMATFLDSWPELPFTNDTSRWIWDMLCMGFVTANMVYGLLDDQQQVLCWDTDSSI